MSVFQGIGLNSSRALPPVIAEVVVGCLYSFRTVMRKLARLLFVVFFLLPLTCFPAWNLFFLFPIWLVCLFFPALPFTVAEVFFEAPFPFVFWMIWAAYWERRSGGEGGRGFVEKIIISIILVAQGQVKCRGNLVVYKEAYRALNQAEFCSSLFLGSYLLAATTF